MSLRLDRARKVIGVPLPDDEIAAVFDRLSCRTDRSAGAVEVEVPSYRFDLQHRGRSDRRGCPPTWLRQIATAPTDGDGAHAGGANGGRSALST